MKVDPRTPCLIGVAQRTDRSGASPEPLDLWVDACQAAARDSGATGDVLGAADSLQVVFCQSWQYDDPAGRLAERLGTAPRHRLYSGIGGTTPQLLVQKAAESVLRGELDVVVVTGAEALETRRQLKKHGRRPEWSHRDPEKKPYPFEAPFHPAEVAHQVFQAWLTFPVFDVARRAHLGAAPEEYRRRLGALMAPMTEVAEANAHAWFPRRRDADALVTPTSDNRMVGYPYTKHMVSVMDVDMSAALVLASEEKADSLGVPRDRRVYLRGWCYATDVTYLAERDRMWESPAMKAVSAEALRTAGLGIDDVAHLDLYSCFASSINLALDALGLDQADGRPVTVTGGLPFAGGPASNYMSHSIAAMADVLRADPGAVGMVSGVGMHMTKHAYGLYSTEPGRAVPEPPADVQARLDRGPTRAIRDTYAGPATVAAYTVAHARSGEPEWGLAVCDVPDGQGPGERCYARMEGADLLAEAERTELVGATVALVPGDGNMNVLKR